MKNLCILPSIDDPQNTNFLKFEWNLFSICSSDNVCESAIYIVPIPSKDKLFIRYLRRGESKGFTKKFLPVLLEKYKYKEEDVFVWNAYSDQDMKHESTLNKYPDRSTKGFNNLMYHKKFQWEISLVKSNSNWTSSTVCSTPRKRIQDQILQLTSK